MSYPITSFSSTGSLKSPYFLSLFAGQLLTCDMVPRQLEERIRHKINKELEDSSNGAKMFLADDSTEDVENPGAAGEGPKTGNVKISAGQLATPLRRLTSHPFLGDHAFRQKFDAKQLEEITKALPGDTKDPPVKFLHDCFSILRDDVKSRAPSPEKEIKCALCRNPPEDPCAGPVSYIQYNTSPVL